MEKFIKKLSVWAVVVAGLLTIPLVTNAPWTSIDYIFAGVVLFGSATVYEFATRNMSNKSHRIMVGFAVLAVVVLIWGWAVAGP